MRREEEPIRIALVLEGEMAKRFEAVKKKWGLEANTDVIRMLITNYYDQMPRGRSGLEHTNIDSEGVWIKDWDLDTQKGRLVHVNLKSDPNNRVQAYCEFHETQSCNHIDFALDLPEVQKILKEKGWKLR